MSDITLEPNFTDHPKVIGLSDAAFRSHIRGMCWCAKYETDGVVALGMVKRIASPESVSELVGAALWIQREDGQFEIKDYLHYNPSREEIERAKEFKQRRKGINLNATLCAALKKRDCDRCRYCGVEVDWKDRRGPAGGTYDHVRPISRGGSDDEPNLVVCCRRCNSGKGDRTPSEAGMVLLPEPSRTAVGTRQKTGEYAAENLQVNAGRTNISGQIQTSVTDQSPDPAEQPASLGSGRARRWRRVPEDWRPTDAHRELAAKLVVDFAIELEKFRDHEFRDPKTDADAAFRTWLRNAKRFAGNGVRKTGVVQPSHGATGFEDM